MGSCTVRPLLCKVLYTIHRIWTASARDDNENSVDLCKFVRFTRFRHGWRQSLLWIPCGMFRKAASSSIRWLDLELFYVKQPPLGCVLLASTWIRLRS